VPTMRAQHSKGFMRCRSGEARWKTNENARALISMMAGSTNTLQSEAGYIDARPQAARSMKPLATHGRTYIGVKNGYGGTSCDGLSSL